MIKTSPFAAQEREAKLDKLGDVLQVMERHVDFGAIATEIDVAAPRPSRERGGCPPFPTELMVRVLLIQQIFNLSDEQSEFQLLDRLSFQRFVGLRSSSQIPDRTTIWTFRERLIRAGASESILAATNRQLARHGYITRGGQMIDASIVQAPRQSLTKEENALVKEGAMPIGWKPAKRRQKDIEARWTKKHGKSYFGYKVSANADKRYKLVRKIMVSTASEHDTLHFEAVLDPANTNRDILADKGYVDGEREARLSKQGWRLHIQRKGSKDKPISATQKQRAGSPRLQAASTRPASFLGGVWLLWHNPKAWAMTIGAAASFAAVASQAQELALTLALALGLAFGVAALLSLSLWCLAGQLLASLLRTERQWRILNGALALLLVISIMPMW